MLSSKPEGFRAVLAQGEKHPLHPRAAKEWILPSTSLALCRRCPTRRASTPPAGTGYLVGALAFAQPRVHRQVFQALPAAPQDVLGDHFAVLDRAPEQQQHAVRARDADAVPMDLLHRSVDGFVEQGLQILYLQVVELPGYAVHVSQVEDEHHRAAGEVAPERRPAEDLLPDI